MALTSIRAIEQAYKEAYIYIFRLNDEKNEFYSALTHQFSKPALRFFYDLDSFATEVMDFLPRLIIIDVEEAKPELFILISRLKKDKSTFGIPIFVRLSKITEQSLSQLIFCGINDIVHDGIPARKNIDFIKNLLDGKPNKQGLNLNNHDFMQKLEDRMQPLEGILPTLDMQTKFTNYYKLDFASHVQTPCQMSGDLWGLHPIDKHRFAIYCVDFSGHGLVTAQNTLRLHTLMQAEDFEKAHPDRALNWLNNRLNSILPMGRYAAMFYGVVDLKDNRLDYACAAILPQICRSETNQAFKGLDGSGLPLGFMKNASYDLHSVPFNKGAMLILYTDALVETPSPPHNVFSDTSLVERLNDLPENIRSESIIATLLQELDLKRHGLNDDLTLIALKVE